MSNFKPMLAVSMDDSLELPLLCTPKVDGIRGLTIDGKVVTRKLIEIPNEHIQKLISIHIPDGCDFEITATSNGVVLGRNETQSAVMSEDGTPEFKIWIFDYFANPKQPYEDRIEEIETIIDGLAFGNCLSDKFGVEVLTPTKIGADKPIIDSSMSSKEIEEVIREYKADCLISLNVLYQKAVREGFEGVITRKPGSPYKYGRSTLKQGYLMRYKAYEDSEAKIIGFEEQFKNTNNAEVDELGNTKRSNCKSGKIPKDTLGSFWVQDVYSGVKFKISKGEGLTNELRKQFWDDRDNLMGKIIKYKYDPTGEVNKPQMASWLGFRDVRDMS